MLVEIVTSEGWSRNPPVMAEVVAFVGGGKAVVQINDRVQEEMLSNLRVVRAATAEEVKQFMQNKWGGKNAR